MSAVVSRPAKSRLQLVLFLLQKLDRRVVKPSTKAFFFAYLYVVLPKLINHIVVSVKKSQFSSLLPRVTTMLARALHPKKFPMFAAGLVAGINLLEPLLYDLLRNKRAPANSLFFSTFVSALVSALALFPRYQNHILKYGRYFSLDLTLLLVTRACDTALSSNLAKIAPASLAGYGDGILFSTSSAIIMYCWFFNPEKLPPAYAKWITSAANMDDELVWFYRGMKHGTLKYGEYRAPQEKLWPLCDNYGQDRSYVDLRKSQPLDCKVIHSFQTDNCELHALWRWWRGFVFALKLYGPLNAFVLLFPKKTKMSIRIINAIKGSVRSSCFLATFIFLCWYPVCLVRSRIFPRLFPKVAKTYWDDTIAPTAGSLACGISCFIERAQRRKELALFVAPRALGTFVSSNPSRKNLQIESVVFSVSLATLVAYSRSDASKVRGLFGKGLQQVFKPYK